MEGGPIRDSMSLEEAGFRDGQYVRIKTGGDVNAFLDHRITFSERLADKMAAIRNVLALHRVTDLQVPTVIGGVAL